MNVLKAYIEVNITKTENLNKRLNFYRFEVPRYDFRDVIHTICDAITLLQPNPKIYGEYHMPKYYDAHPEEYLEYKKKIINYVTKNLSKDNVMLPIIEDFDYKRWSGRWNNVKNLDELMFSDITEKLGFDGYSKKYNGPWYFYRIEPINS
jgi:hypothetical protein